MNQNKSITLLENIKQLLSISGGRNGGAIVVPVKPNQVTPTELIKVTGGRDGGAVVVPNKPQKVTSKQLLEITGGRGGGAVVVPKSRSIIQPTPVVKVGG